MSRACLISALALLLLPGLALAEGGTVNEINGIGMIDYGHGRSSVQVGGWAKYHVTSKSEMGASDDYTVTVLIPGEEHWWGEDCFWVETWTEKPGAGPRAAATLMSYAIFDDTLAIPHMQLYMRKTINGLRDDGTLAEDLYKRPASSLKSREPIGNRIRWNVDSLGTELVKTLKGDFECRKVRIEQGTGVNAQGKDSSEYTEMREVRVTFLTPRVPITNIAREEIEYGFKRKTWLIGRSEEGAPLQTIDVSRGVAELVDFGTSGLEARLLPKDRAGTLAERRAAAARAAKPVSKPATRPSRAPGTKKPG